MIYEDFLEIEVMVCCVGSYFYLIDDKVIYIFNWDISVYMIYEVSLVKMLLKYWIFEEMILDMNIVKMMMIDELEILDVVIVCLL